MPIDLKEWDDLVYRFDSLTPAEAARLDKIVDEFFSTPEGEALQKVLNVLSDIEEEIQDDGTTDSN